MGNHMSNETALEIAGEEHRVLHALRVRGLLELDALVITTGLERETVSAVIEDAVQRGDVVRRDGRLSGFTLLPSGRERHTASMTRERAGADLAALEAADAAFVPLNEAFKQLCFDWQSSDSEAQRTGLLPQMEKIHGDAREIVRRAASGVARFSVYGSRLDAALQRLLGGDDDALLRPLSESYHDVWMELHHDLLLTIGRERSDADGH
jgi:hypothetical protein